MARPTDEESRRKTRIPVIVVVDIDDDLGQVLGESLLVGEESVKRAIIEYGEKRPTDPDVNALLVGLNLYKRFLSEGRKPLLIAVGGHPTDFLRAQSLIRERVREALETAGIKEEPEFYIVSDGEDEFVISQVLRELGSIAGFKRVIVEQSLDIEGRYLLILKYLKKAAFDPRFSKYFLGIPGLAITLFALLSIVGKASIAAKAAALVLGLAMVFRGFNLEEPFENWLESFLSGLRERPHLQFGGLAILLIAVSASIITARNAIEAYGYSLFGFAEVSRTSMPLLLVGIATYVLIAGVFYKLVYEDESMLNDIAIIMASIFAAIAFYALGDYIESYHVNEFTVNILVDSGFMQLMISGTGIAAILEMARRVKKRRSEHAGEDEDLAQESSLPQSEQR